MHDPYVAQPTVSVVYPLGENDGTVKAVLTSIHVHVHQRRSLVILALVLIALFGALLVASVVDGHLHIGGATVISMDAASVDRVINSLLFLAGVFAVPQLLRLIPKRTIAPNDDLPSPSPASPRFTMPPSPCLLALCRIQV